MHLPVETMPLEGLMSMWQDKADRGEDALPQDMPSPSFLGEDFDYCDPDYEDEYPELREYREALVNSPAYSWLASTIAAELQHETLGVDVRGLIRRQIIELLTPTEQKTISQKLAPPASRVVFSMPWFLPYTLNDQDYQIPHAEALPRVLVFTGISNNVQASTVSEYISRVWPFYGPAILSILTELLRQGTTCREPRKCFPLPPLSNTFLRVFLLLAFSFLFISSFFFLLLSFFFLRFGITTTFHVLF